MATYPTFQLIDLSEFSGRPGSEYTNVGYVATALAQSALLFKLGTCLKEWPDDPIKSELAKMAILSMADAIYLVQPFQKTLANPFSSETIGSYSYSKISGAVMSGLPTGITWFDMALNQLGVCDLEDAIPKGGGIEVFEDDGIFALGRHAGNVEFLSPEDVNNFRVWSTDPSEGGKSSPQTSGGAATPSGNLDGGSA